MHVSLVQHRVRSGRIATSWREFIAARERKDRKENIFALSMFFSG